MIFVTPQWLHAHLYDEHIKIIDGSWHMPSSNSNARAEYEAQHIENTVFFDIDEVSDHSTPLPHMLPNAAEFSNVVSALGIKNDDHIIIYDSVGLFSAARVRFMFKSFGHDNVSILEGGLPTWVAAGLPVASLSLDGRGCHVVTGEGEMVNSPSSVCSLHSQPPSPIKGEGFTVTAYKVSQAVQHIANKVDVENAVEVQNYQIIDARPAPRFLGEIDEPRPNLRRGHIDTSKNVPFATLIENGKLKQIAKLQNIFHDVGIDISKPAITSCGSGVSAAIVSLALEVLDAPPSLLYDGSWSEWGML